MGESETHDIVIHGGTIVDGTGASKVVGDIAINDGILTNVDGRAGSGHRELSADGALVTTRGAIFTLIKPLAAAELA